MIIYVYSPEEGRNSIYATLLWNITKHHEQCNKNDHTLELDLNERFVNRTEDEMFNPHGK